VLLSTNQYWNWSNWNSTSSKPYYYLLKKHSISVH
jgi:hypothetical protein